MLSDLGNFLNDRLNVLFDTQVTDIAVDNLIKDICTKLIQSNVNPKHILLLRTKIREKIQFNAEETNRNKAKVVHKAVFQSLIEFLDPEKEAYKIEKGKQSVIVFVGLQGAGKTTSICKYAYFYKKKGFRVGIVCADTFRAGAFDQVRQNAEKISVPYFGSSEADPIKVAKEGVTRFRRSNFDLILVDTSGRHTQEEELFMEMKGVMHEVCPDNIVFVMDAGIGQSAEDQAEGFKKAVKVGGIILTKIDGAAKAGGALSSVAATKCPIEFIGTGEKMEDLEKFNSKGFVSKLLNMGDVEGLMEKFNELDLDAEEITGKLAEGKFTLGDFHNFYKQICSLGPLQNLLKMTPGLSKLEIPDENKLRKITFIFDSMCKSELQSCGNVFNKQPTRINRIARGSGTTTEEVTELLHNFKTMSNVAKKVMQMPGMAEMFGMQSKVPKKGKEFKIDPEMFSSFTNSNM
ncbi:signal recognition particle subunit FFHSRP54 [Nucleospora cyclopteri]